MIKHTPTPKDQLAKLGRLQWSVAALFELSRDLKVMSIPLEHMNTYYLYETMTLAELAGHINAVNDADLEYPIILDEDGEIMDGRHRLMKAMITGKKTIKAVRFKVNPTPMPSKDD